MTITPSTSTPTSELGCITFNCNGLTSRRLEEVHRGILDADPDVVLLQELKEAQTTGVHISGYRTCLRKRTVKRGDGSLDSGGGIATLVRSSIKAKVVFSSMQVMERLDVRCTGHRGTHVTMSTGRVEWATARRTPARMTSTRRICHTDVMSSSLVTSTFTIHSGTAM